MFNGCLSEFLLSLAEAVLKETVLHHVKFLHFQPTEATQASSPGLWTCLIPPSTSRYEQEQQSDYSFLEELSQSHHGPAMTSDMSL